MTYTRTPIKYIQTIRIRLKQTFTNDRLRRVNIKVEKILNRLDTIDRMIVISTQSAYATLIHSQTTSDSEETAKKIIGSVADVLLRTFHQCECYGVDDNGVFWFDEVKFAESYFDTEALEKLYAIFRRMGD